MANAGLPNSTLVIPALQQRTAVAIFAHGLGQRNSSWQIELQYLAQCVPYVEWVIPQASQRRISLIGGEQRPAWFDVRHLPPSVNEFDEAAINESIHLIEQIIMREVQEGVDSKRILLVGFSQGAALCLMVALTTLHEIGGVASLSGWIPHQMREQMLHAEPGLPVYWGHGANDTEIPLRYARDCVAFLRDTLGVGYPYLIYVEYADTQHEVSDEELFDLSTWIAAALNEPTVPNGL